MIENVLQIFQMHFENRHVIFFSNRSYVLESVALLRESNLPLSVKLIDLSAHLLSPKY